MDREAECGSRMAGESPDQEEEEEEGLGVEPHFTSFPYGFQQRYHYSHSKKQTELVDVTVNTRTKQFILLDSRGITTWNKDAISNAVTRSLGFPKYQNHLIRNIIFAKKFNVYFCLAHDFSLKVLNKDFEETCTADSDLSSVMFMVFNPARDELITGGVKGVKVWEFKQIADRIWTEIRPMANYGLFLKKELASVGGAWVRKLELNERLQHLYCCSDIDVSCHDMDGRFLFKINRAHSSRITGCKYSPECKVLVTSSFDCEVKVWSLTGGLVHTFRGHSRGVTNLLLHPETSALVLSSSLDGTVRMWSLDIMEEMYCIVMSTEGINWMGLIADRSLWTATSREISIWNIDQAVQFYALVRSRVTSIQVAQSAGKTSRVLAVGEDSSVRLVSMRDRRNLSTVLPPPSLSPLQQVLAVSYNRECNLAYLLINPQEIWVYTMRTDPACRTAVWDVRRIQERFNRVQSPVDNRPAPSYSDGPATPIKSALTNNQISRATARGKGSCLPCPCTALTTVNSNIVYWTKEGSVTPLQSSFLVLGLQDGRIVFLDPIKFGHRYCELQACKNLVIELYYDSSSSILIARSHLREEDMVQLWSLPDLDLRHEVLAQRDATCYAYASDTFMMGHMDGSVSVYKFTTGSPLGVLYTVPLDDGQPEHLAPVLSVDSCLSLGVFVSCSEDGVIKIWSSNKVLCTEIVVEDSLTCTRFLNQQGDLLIGYKNHMFYIHRSKVLASFQRDSLDREESFDSESDIYEDPAVRYEGAAANPDPLSLETYLVPFDLDFSSGFLAGEASPQQSKQTSDQDEDSDSDSGYSMAPTDIYISPTGTPRRLSYIDLILPGDCITNESLRNQSVTIVRRRKAGKSLMEVVKPQSQEVLDHFSWPEFGVSPGPSPSPSPPSTPTDFNLSERESETESEEDVLDADREKEGRLKDDKAGAVPVTVVKQAIKVNCEQKETSVTSVAKQGPAPRPRFGMSGIKIDAKTLIKNSDVALSIPGRSGSASSGRKVSLSGNKKQDMLEAAMSASKLPSSKKKIEKKKKKVVDRQRTGGKRPIRTSAPDGDEEMDKALLKNRFGKKSSTKSFQKSVHSVIKSKTASLDTISSSQSVKGEKQLAGTKTSQPSIKNLPMDGNTTRQPYRASSSSTGGREGDKQLKRRKKSSIFSNYKKLGNAADEGSSLEGGLDAIDHPAGRNSEDTSGPSLLKAVSRATIVQKYNPLDKLSLSNLGSKKNVDPSESTTGQVEEPPDRVKSASSQGANAEIAIHQTGEQLPQGGITSFEGETLRDHSSESPQTSRLEELSRVGTPIDEGASSSTNLIGSSNSRNDDINDEAGLPSQQSNVSESSLNFQEEEGSQGIRPMGSPDLREFSQESVIDVSISRSGRDLDTAMGSLSIGGMSRPSTSASLGEGALSMLSYYEDCGSVYAMSSRPLSVLSGPLTIAAGSELAEIARLRESLIMRSNLRKGAMARPNSAKGERPAVRYQMEKRPHTAGENMHVTFLDELDRGTSSLSHGLRPDAEQFRVYARPSPEIFKYHKNDGLNLEADWQDKMIERHKLMKVQKELQSRSAAEKRHLLDLRRRQKRKALTGHRDCTDDQTGQSGYQCGFPTHSEPFVDMRRSRSAPPMSNCQCNPSPRPPSRGIPQEVLTGPTPPPRRKKSLTSSKPESSSDRVNFKSEIPYRFRLSSQEVCATKVKEGGRSSRSAVRAARTRSLGVQRAISRPHTSKSIPSKARRFILIPSGQSESQMGQATPLEVQLLGERFPNSQEHLKSRSSLLSHASSISGHKVIPTISDQNAILT